MQTIDLPVLSIYRRLSNSGTVIAHCTKINQVMSQGAFEVNTEISKGQLWTASAVEATAFTSLVTDIDWNGLVHAH